MEPARHIECCPSCAESCEGCLSAPVRAAPSRARRHRGFTLVELVLIVGIIAVLATLAFTTYQGYRERLKINQAVGDILLISTSITEFSADNGRLPAGLAEVGKNTMLDPWGNPYGYVNHATEPKGNWRKDKNIVPINSDFDLYSSGKDGGSVGPLTAKVSRDDIVRANDGRFVGPASVYDP